MHNRVLRAVTVMAAIVPSLAIAQQRPAAPPAARPATPPAQRPAARPTPPAARPMTRMAGPARANAWQFGIQGGIMYLDNGLNNRLIARGIHTSTSKVLPGGAISLSKQLGNHLALGIGSGFFTGSGATVIAPRAELTLSTDIDKPTVFFVPVGASLTRISGNSNRMTSQWGAHAGLGLLHFFGTGNTALRIEGRESMDRFAESGGFTAYDAQGLLGLSFFFGGGPARDTDMDGVPDKKDRCVNTPRGAIVDARGCPSDSDNDHVWNGLDRCANTPANTPVDANGCPRDTDNDGVNDAADRCPNTPAGTPVDANGCPRDADGDGVNDAADRCPNTPTGARVDANGCPLAPDADRDGVEDARDRCPNTPAGRMVDANGCPLAELPAVGASLVIRNVNFPSGSSRILASSNRGLDDIAASIQAILRQSPNARFEVGGYTDNRGVAASNRRLSQARAQAVVTYLTGKGVPASALTAVGYGPDNPKAPNTTAAGRAQNRRVEIKRLS